MCKITADLPIVYHITILSLRVRRKFQIVCFWSVFMLVVKRLGREAPSRAEFKNAWSSTFTLPIRFRDGVLKTGDSLTFTSVLHALA